MRRVAFLPTLIIVARSDSASTIEDDRGVRRALRELGSPRPDSTVRFRRGSFSFQSRDAGLSPAQRSARIARRVLYRNRKTTWVERLKMAIMAAVVLGVCGRSVFFAESRSAAAMWVLAAVAIFGLQRVVVLASRRLDRHDRRTLASLPPSCPCCGYDLATLPADPDGHTVCPECDVAWRFPIA